MSCPINYDHDNCSSKEYDMACDTCIHNQGPVREFFRIEADTEFSPYWSHEITIFSVVEAVYRKLIKDDSYSNVKAVRVTEYMDGHQVCEELFIR